MGVYDVGEDGDGGQMGCGEEEREKECLKVVVVMIIESSVEFIDWIMLCSKDDRSSRTAGSATRSQASHSAITLSYLQNIAIETL